jgi:hypothetical protein
MLINESFHKLMGYQGIDPFPDLWKCSVRDTKTHQSKSSLWRKHDLSINKKKINPILKAHYTLL